MDELRARLEELASARTAGALPPPAHAVLRRGRRRVMASRVAAGLALLLLLGVVVVGPRLVPARRDVTMAPGPVPSPLGSDRSIGAVPLQGPPGTVITVSGPGCHPIASSGVGWSPAWSTRMEIHLFGQGKGGVAEVRVDPEVDGSWQATYTVPADLPPGVYELTVTCDEQYGPGGGGSMVVLPGRLAFTVTAGGRGG